MSKFGLIQSELFFWRSVRTQRTPAEMASAIEIGFWDLVPGIFARTGSSSAVGTVAMELRQLARLVRASRDRQDARSAIEKYRGLRHA